MQAKKIKVAVVGYGVVGKKRVDYILCNKEVKLVAVCDRNLKNVEYIQGNIKCYTSYKEIFLLDIDAIFVCLPNDMASNIVIQGLKNNLHIFCEKPPARNMKEMKSVIEEYKKHPKLKLIYGFNHRYHDSIKEALTIVMSGKLGKLISMRGVYGKSKLVTFNQNDWRTKRKIAGGGVLLDQGIHMVDLMRLFAGSFSQVHSFVSNDYWKHDVEDNAYALMRTDSGVVAMINSSATEWRHRFQMDITLEKGSLSLGGILSGSKSYGDETLTVIESDDNSGNPKQITTRYNQDNSWAEEISTFISAIRENYNIENGDVYDAYETLKLVFQIYYADKSWRKKFTISNPN